MSFIGFGFRVFYEFASNGRSYQSLLNKLIETESVCHARIVNANDNTFTRSRTVHVIGIERWGAQRLRVLLGEPLVIDEYDGYAPSEQMTVGELAEEFRRTRAATIALVEELQRKGVPLTAKVKHNEAGDLSLRGWLFYLENHMWRETFVLMPGSKQQSKEATGA